MKSSESLDKLAPALVKAFAEIEAATKDSTNPMFRSKYADLNNHLDAVRPVLAKHKLAVLQPPETLLGLSDDGKSEAPVVLIKTIILHESGQWMEGEIALPFVEPEKNEAGRPKVQLAQAMGSAITYMRRYSLASMLSIPAEDDDGEAAMGRGNGYARDSAPTPVQGRPSGNYPRR